MKRKIIGIFVCLMLLSTIITTVINPKGNISKAVEVPQSESLDYNYIYNKTVEFANVIYMYNQTDIPKGRHFGSKGGIYTKDNILIPEMTTNLNLENITVEQLKYIDENNNNYSCLINVSDFRITVNTTGDYRYGNPIPMKEVGIVPGRDFNIKKNWSKTIWSNNTEIFKIDMKKRLFDGIRNILTHQVKNFVFLNSDLSPLIGNVTYLSQNDSVPNSDQQVGRVFLLDDVQGVQNKIENITNAGGIIIIDTGQNIANGSNCPYPVVRISNGDGNDVKDLLNEEIVIVDNVGSLSRDLTFSYNIGSDPISSNPYVVIDKIPDHYHFLQTTIWNSIFLKNIARKYGHFKNPTFWDYLQCVGYKSGIFHIFTNCKAIILYDSGDYHWTVSPFADRTLYNTAYLMPIITVNNSVGSFLSNNTSNTKLNIYLKQVELKETNQTPGAIGYNIYGNKTICKSPNNETAIISNRYDGMWGQTPGDSGASTAILLGIAKYFKDHPGIKPKYNLTFLFTTAEECGFEGARFHADNHSYIYTHNKSLQHWLIIEQLAFDQADCGVSIFVNNSPLLTMNAIKDESHYSGYPSWVRAGAGPGSEQATINREFNKSAYNLSTICLFKGDRCIGKDQNGEDKFVGYSWDHWHRAGNNYTDGDSMAHIDRNDINQSALLVWDIIKYYMVNPDCHFNGTASFSAIDVDSDSKMDSIHAEFSVKTSLPIDTVRVRAKLKNSIGTTILWKDFDFNATSQGTSKFITVTLPPTITGTTEGNYRLNLALYNSTGRINEIVGTGDWNDSCQMTTDYHLYPRSNVNANKPNNITGPQIIRAFHLVHYNSSTTDTNNDQLEYQWNWTWPSEDDSTLYGSYDSGDVCHASHVYNNTGTKMIRVRARENFSGQLFDYAPALRSYGNWSNWSNLFNVTVKLLLILDMSLTSAAASQSSQTSILLPSVLTIDSIYTGEAFGGDAPYSYKWYFQGNLAPPPCQQTVAYNYSQTGTKTVTLNVTDSEGHSNETSAHISVVPLCANFNSSLPSTLYANPDEAIVFNDTSAACNNRHIENWTWHFGDGNISYERNATHQYYDIGVYNVTLTISDNTSEISNCSKFINFVYDNDPPEITYVDNNPDTVGYGYNVSIIAVVTDDTSGVANVTVNITYPDNTSDVYPMTHIINDTYQCIFSNTMQIGVYPYSIQAVDNANNTASLSGFDFTVAPTPIISFATPPTPENNATIDHNWTQVNVTVQDTRTTSAFIDWNRNLKGYWPMEAYSTTGVYDNSTYDNFGWFHNGIGSSNITTGRYGKALEFDGTDDYVDVGKDASLNLGTSDFTFMVWEKSHQNTTSNVSIMFSNRPEIANKGYFFGVTSTGPRLYTMSAAGQTTSVTGTKETTDNVWHHLAYVRRGTNLSLFVDGVFDHGVTGTLRDVTNTQNTSLSYENHASWSHFDGLLDEPQLYTRALSLEEIKAAYDNSNNSLAHNFTALADGTYNYYAHAIDTTGNHSSTETRTVTIDACGPTITGISATPTPIGFGGNVTIQATIIDYGTNVSSAYAHVNKPGQWQPCLGTNITMTLASGTANTYRGIFNDTWNTGRYNYTITATDATNHQTTSTTHSFNGSATATLNVYTLKNSYTTNEYINLTDPPSPPDAYTLQDRGATWNTYYDTTTGNTVMDTYPIQVNYQPTTDDTWQPINITLSMLSQDSLAYQKGYTTGNNQGPYAAYFKPNSQDTWPVAFAYNRSQDPTITVVRTKLTSVGYIDPASWSSHTLQTIQNSQGQTTDNTMNYPSIFTGTNLTYTYENTHLKEAIVLSNTTKNLLLSHPPSQYGLGNTSYLVFATKIDSLGLTTYDGQDQITGNHTVTSDIEFKDSLNRFACALPIGFAYEQGNTSATVPLTYRIVHQGGDTYLLSGLPVSTLTTMTFPVVIDPTITVTSLSNDGYVYSSSSTYNTAWTATTGTISSTSTSLFIGQDKTSSIPPSYYDYRSMLLFNTSTLPYNANISSAKLSLFKFSDNSTTDFTITIQNGQPTYPHDPLQTGDYAKSHYSGNGGGLNTTGFVNGWNNITLTNTSWLTKQGETKLCLRSNKDISGTTPTTHEYVKVFSGNSNQQTMPKLTILFKNQSKINNTGSTDIKGYLLIQVQFYKSGTGWIVDNDTVHETTPRTITASHQFGLDTVFNGKIKRNDLKSGNGTYRIYAAFRDPEGNILVGSDQKHLSSSWQFTVSGL
jgi:hypothetical protein